MLRSSYNYWKGILDKLIPIKYQGYIFLLSFLIIIPMWIIGSLEKDQTNKIFYNLELYGKVNDIILKENGYHYKIDSNWYLIKHIIVKHIEIGDSIIKESNSLDIIIKGTNKIKWNSNVKKNIYFRIIRSEKRNE